MEKEKERRREGEGEGEEQEQEQEKENQKEELVEKKNSQLHHSPVAIPSSLSSLHSL